MGKRKRKATPVVHTMKSRKKARHIVTQFHKLEEQLSTVAKKDAQKREIIEEAMTKLGGRAAYQAASNLSVSHFNTSKWVLKQLRDMGLKPSHGGKPLEALEVGAINTFLLDCTWLKVDAIDLESGHDRIRQADFFDLPVEPARYDVIVCSMVLNSVPDARRRGVMLQRMKGFVSILQTVGFTIVGRRTTPKVEFFVCRRQEEASQNEPEEGSLRASASGVKKTRVHQWVKDFDVIL